MEILEIEDLLKEVSTKIVKHEEEKRKSKDSFNFFKVLGITRKETYHSKFIAELLNPKGLHDCGAIFLKQFLDMMPMLESINIDYNIGDYVQTEQHMGYLDEEQIKGGRADIVIRINGHLILIENKIYAGEQKNQIIRYHNYKIENELKCKSCTILYLTLNGDIADSSGDLIETEAFHCISYKKHINEWLIKCIEVSKEHLIIQQTIKGYLTVINFLTDQSSFHIMQNEIKNLILSNQKYIDAVYHIPEIIEIIKKESSAKIFKIHNILKTDDRLRKVFKKEIAIGDVQGDGSEFIISIPVANSLTSKINIGRDLTCYAVSDFFKNEQKNFTIKEPHTAEEFVSALIDELNNILSN